MTTAAPKIEESPWIEWPGGDMPVAPETLVTVRFRSGRDSGGPYAARSWVWQHEQSSGDIIAYRVISAPQPEQIAEEALPQSETPRTDAIGLKYREQEFANQMTYLARQLERELAEMRNAEHTLSDAYLRLCEILKAWDTPTGPTPEEVYAHTEAKARAAVAALKAREPAASASMDEHIEALAREDAGGSALDWTMTENLGATALQRAAFRRGFRAALQWAQAQREYGYGAGSFMAGLEHEVASGPLNLPESQREQPAEERGGAVQRHALWIDYTNYKGERSIRLISPRRLYYGSTAFHPEPQWLIHADDIRKGERTFALMGIHRFSDTELLPHIDRAPEQAAKGDEAIRKAAERVVWFDWSDNDSDAVEAIEALRVAIASRPEASA